MDQDLEIAVENLLKSADKHIRRHRQWNAPVDLRRLPILIIGRGCTLEEKNDLGVRPQLANAARGRSSLLGRQRAQG